MDRHRLVLTDERTAGGHHVHRAMRAAWRLIMSQRHGQPGLGGVAAQIYVHITCTGPLRMHAGFAGTGELGHLLCFYPEDILHLALRIERGEQPWT